MAVMRTSVAGPARMALALAVALRSVSAQQVGNNTPEVHPHLTTWSCTNGGGCTPQNTSIVLDSGYRWIHTIGGYQNCNLPGGGLNKTLCPDAATCAQNCVLEGVNYTATGIHTQSNNSHSSLTLDMYVDGHGSSPRVYLLGEDGNYEALRLVNREFTFDVDMSKLPCGMNGALYLSEMSLSGGKSGLNRAGAAMGTGYCDAQCPVADFLNGEANVNRTGACCNEMDIWEANSRATALTPHTCNITGVYACTGDACNDGPKGGVCDKGGCGYNAYSQGHPNFYGPNGTVDTTRPFTVVTQFIAGAAAANSTHKMTTASKTANAAEPVLTEIRRLYLQDGRLIANVSSPATANATAATSKKSVSNGISITDEFCGNDAFEKLGGLKGMGEALQRGMVLIFSIWNDNGQFMNWLDSGNAGPCDAKAGDPALIQKNNPGTSVTWSNIKWGDIGSTFKATR
ncbi:beta-glucanase [Niveomyces insectorum RCEF 264]|uniref:Glucanase n=1 Tax=Niveomyces insectorum RCEF 264 TaxID=1081102 RepID=A0A167N8V6_9HYPO|nr:beta-glucanase [Niveomyces insectorum RCEF 264]